MTSLAVIESFLDSDRAAKVWPKSITGNETFLKQTEQRRILLLRLNKVTDYLPRPDMSLESAIEQGYINEEQVARLYASLSDLLEFDSEYKRLILYLPFEFLPTKAWRPCEKILRQASRRFKKSYMKAWKDLLSTQDVRANFLDGDVLEIEQRVGDLPRVVKAAHLMPKLVEKGLMEVKDVIALMEESRDQTLKDSIADTLPVLADMGLIAEKEIRFMEESKDWLVNSMARIILANMNAENRQIKTAPRAITLLFVQQELAREFSRIDAAECGDITEKRKNWLKQSGKQKAIESLAEIVSAVIIENGIANESIIEFLDQKIDIATIQVLIEGIRKAIELTASTDLSRALEIYEQYQDIMLKLWENNNAQVNETLLKTFHHLYHLKIIDDKQLAKLNIVLPELAGPFSKNLELIKQELSDIENMTRVIESDSKLSQLIYPIILVFGSRLKGCGTQNADIDLGIFVRPGVSFNDRTKLQELYGKIFTHEKVRDKIVEFWLEEKEGIIQVRDFDDSDVSLGESYWTHILFGSAWIGDEKTIYSLIEKLLVPYLYDTGKTIHGLNARRLYLEELERDTLQYRLMHKGYEQFFPRYGGMKTLHADEIDGKSMFWDSGYRQLATKLFINRVFLPKIPIPKIKE